MLADYFLTRFVAFSASCLFSPMRSSCKFVYTRKSVLHVVKSADVQGKVVFSAHSNIKLLLTQVAVCVVMGEDTQVLKNYWFAV